VSVVTKTILGRDAELALVERLLDDISESPVLVFEGEAGIGKTTVWRAGAEAAERRNIAVLRAQPAESERMLSYAAVTDLLATVWDDVRDTLPEPQRRALGVALLREEASEGAERRTVATAFLSALSALAVNAPVLLAVDDAQWLDPASRHAIEFAARRLPPGVGLLIAYRTSAELHGHPRLAFDRLEPPGRFRRVRVGPLSLAALHHAIRDALGTVPARPLLVRIAEVSGGNPFFAIELARASVERRSVTVPRTLHDLVASRLETLSTDARAAVLVAAALSRPTLALVDAAATVSDAGVAIAEAAAAGILLVEGEERIRFSHPLLASAVYDAASTPTRRTLHLRLADVAVDPEERARHIAAAAAGPDERLADEIETGAATAARRGAPVAAAELYDLAYRLTPPSARPEDQVRRQLGLAEALVAAGDSAGGRTVAETAVKAAPGGRLRAAALVGVYRASLHASTPAEAIAALERAAGEVKEEDPELRRTILALLARHTTLVEPRRALRYADDALDELDEERDPADLARVTIGMFFARLFTGQGADLALLERGVRLEEKAGGPEDGAVLPWYFWIDDHDAARGRWEAQTAIAIARGDERDRAERLAVYARGRIQSGEWDEAERMLDEACAVLEQSGVAGPNTLAFAARSLLDGHRGRSGRARDTLRQLLDGSEPSWWRTHHLSILGTVEMAAGDFDAAERAWGRMDAELGAMGVEEAPFDRSEPDRVETRLAAGDTKAARNALARLEWRGRTLPRLWIDVTVARSRALLLAAQGDVEGALAALDELDDDRAARLPLERGRALLLRGALERRAKRKGTARESLEAALEIFAGLGAPPWVERAQAELRRVGRRPTDGDELTPTERRIAELAASGMTNREVAQRAFVSPKTVEANLARVYRKLGIRSRAELGARIGSGTTPK
jgi:DNA-binding CsgD family transcriptional regulator